MPDARMPDARMLLNIGYAEPAMKTSWGFGLLLALSALLVLGAATCDRSSWRSFMGDEATYLMQAESLAFDLDLAYTAGDYHRFVGHWGKKPQGLILQSGGDGELITYGKPFYYPLFLAPFTRLSPLRGPFVANALLLVLTCLLVARVLERRLGGGAALWVAALVFASVVFGHVFWAHADLFLMCLTAVALALVFGRDGDGEEKQKKKEEHGGFPWRWVGAGALLAMVVYSRPLYLPIFLPALLALPRPRWRAGAALLGSVLLVTVATASVHFALTGSWTGYGATRSGFYSQTGFPGVDFPAERFVEEVRELGNSAVLPPEQMVRVKKVSASLWWWNGVHFLFGRHLGLLPYFLPGLLAFAGRPSGAARWSLLLAVLLTTAAFFYLRPFNFYGGGGTLANRYFLPLYPAFWFLPTRPPRPLVVAVAVVVAALFLYPLALHPRAFPLDDGGSYRYVSPVAARVLPFETTQSHLKLAGREDLYGDGFFVRLLDPALDDGRDRFIRLEHGERARLMVASTEPLPVLELLVRARGPVEVSLDGGRVEPLPRRGRFQRFRLHLPPPDARHPTWWSRWTPADVRLLTLRFRGPEYRPIGFRLVRPRAPSSGEPAAGPSIYAPSPAAPSPPPFSTPAPASAFSPSSAAPASAAAASAEPSPSCFATSARSVSRICRPRSPASST